jgi:hypothetical protein
MSTGAVRDTALSRSIVPVHRTTARRVALASQPTRRHGVRLQSLHPIRKTSLRARVLIQRTEAALLTVTATARRVCIALPGDTA